MNDDFTWLFHGPIAHNTVAPPTPNSAVMKPAPRTRKAIARTATQDRRANSLSSPPKTNVPPATISAIRETDSATGPVSEVATLFRGVSHGRPPPPPPAQADGVSRRNSRIARACLRSNFRVMFQMTSFYKD